MEGRRPPQHPIGHGTPTSTLPERNMSWTAPSFFSFFFFLFFNLPFFSASSSKEAVDTVSVHSAKNLLASGYRFLDVRTKEEFIKGHVEGAINIPYLFSIPEGRKKNPRFLDDVSAVSRKDDHIVVGCHSGVRSLNASIELLQALISRNS